MPIVGKRSAGPWGRGTANLWPLATNALAWARRERSQPVAGYAKDAQEITSASGGQPVESAPAQTANFALPVWKRLLNNTTLTIGCNNVFGHDPPDAATSTNYAEFLYDPTGRFVYVSLTKRF